MIIWHGFKSPVVEDETLGRLGKLISGSWMKRFYTSKETQVSHIDGASVGEHVLARSKVSPRSLLDPLTTKTDSFCDDQLTQEDELAEFQREPADEALFVSTMHG